VYNEAGVKEFTEDALYAINYLKNRKEINKSQIGLIGHSLGGIVAQVAAAKIAAERLTVLNANMAKLKTEREKKKYSKIVEKYLETEFEDQLKKLSRKDGQILVKLIYRQTGQSTFDLIKEHKSGWKAFWANRMAKLFSINIKEKYNPATVPEDYYIEGFLLQAFAERRLIRQEPPFEIDYTAITQKRMDKQ
jgi:poly(3-hydroxyalkanoate) synthetase